MCTTSKSIPNSSNNNPLNNNNTNNTRTCTLIRVLSQRRSELSLALVDEDWTRSAKLLRERPIRATKWTIQLGFFDGVKDSSVLPLHQAVALQAPGHLIDQLLTAYPDGVYQPESSYQRLPLHCACRTGAEPATVRLLIQAGGTDTCLQPDRLLRTPLHYALSNGGCLPTVQALIEAAPNAAYVADTRGWTALHVAASAGCALEVLKLVYEANPSAIVSRTKRGNTPKQVVPSTIPHRAELSQFLRQKAAEKEDKNNKSVSTSNNTNKNNQGSSTTNNNQNNTKKTQSQAAAGSEERPSRRLWLHRSASCPNTTATVSPIVVSTTNTPTVTAKPALTKQQSTSIYCYSLRQPRYVPLPVHRTVLV